MPATEIHIIHVTHTIARKPVTCEDAGVEATQSEDFIREASDFWLRSCVSKCRHKDHKVTVQRWTPEAK